MAKATGGSVLSRRAFTIAVTTAIVSALLAGPWTDTAGATATFVVNSTAATPDANPGDGVCLTSVANGSVCTLRAAITEANALAGTDTINFGGLATGSKINVTAGGLPAVTAPVVIDGSTATGTAPTYIRLDGQTNNPTFGLSLAAGSGGSTVRGLSITRAQVGILVASNGNTVTGTFLGLLETSSPTCAVPTGSCANGVGLRVNDASSNVIGGTTAAARNVISNNSSYGVEIRISAGSATSNVLQGNYIGTNGAGTAALANGTTGVRIVDSSSNTVGGTSAGARNVISGNGSYGIEILTSIGTSATNAVQGNYIGTNAAGTAALANGSTGIYVYGTPEPTGTTIGGSAVGAGNVISGGASYGVYLGSGSGTTIAGNLVGLSASGASALGNTSYGVYASAAHDLTIGGAAAGSRNVISANGAVGVYLYDPSALSAGNVVVQNNYIGTNQAGTADLGNGGDGLRLDYLNGALVTGNVIAGNGADNIAIQGQHTVPVAGANHTVSGNIVGLAADGATALGNGNHGINIASTTNIAITGNVISGNGAEGLYMSSDLDATVTNNKIGTNAAGTVAVGNLNPGIYAAFQNNAVIGMSGAGNVISGNDDICTCTFDNHGVYVYASTDTAIQGNLIGTDVSGNVSMGNGGQGIWVYSSDATRIGGAGVGEGNVVAASSYNGILLTDSDNSFILGNKVGVGANGTTALPNAQNGLVLQSASDRNIIGGIAAGAGNLIRNNTQAGINPSGGVSNTIRGNGVDGNGSLGIDIDFNGVTPNDAGDLDGGTNRTQNFPVLTTAASNASGTQVHGTLNSRTNRQYDIDFYASPTCDASGNGEGATYLGSSTATTDGSGNVTFVANLPVIAPFGNAVTATATDTTTGDTSEFSACFTGSTIPTVSISPATPSVGEAAGTANLTVDLSSAPTFTPVTVNYATSTGTAGAADFTTTSGTVTFGVGETSKPVTVPITSDLLDEDNETFTVALSNPNNTLIAAGGGQSTVTIIDDDAPPTISVNDAPTVTETAGGATQTFTVSLSAASSKTITVLASTNPGSASAGSDYASTAAVVTFNPGTTTQTVNVTVNDDLIDENNETYELDLTTPTYATIADGIGVGTIADDDTWPTVSVAADSPSVGESGSAGFTVTLSQSSTQSVSVTWQTADGTAGSADYTQQAPQVLTFTPGQTSLPISVPITSDAIDEANETFSVTLSSPTNSFLATSSASETITDDDATPTLSVSDPANVTEIPGGVTQTFVVTLSAVSGLPVSAVAATSAGTAGEGSDYAGLATAVSFAPGTTTQNVVVTVVNDDLDEPNETYDVVLSSIVNAGVSDGTGTGTIVDEDIYPTITISPASPAVAESGTAAFNVDLSQASNLTVSVTWQTANGTATGGTDFTAQAPTVLTFTPGQTSTPISVPISTDSLDEDNETFSVTLSNATHGTVLAGSSVTIIDDDAPPSVSLTTTPAIVNEGGNQTFTVSLSTASGRTVSVVAFTVDGTAIHGSDYVTNAQTLTFAPGVTTQSFVVSTIDDVVDEPNQTYSAQLASPVNATLGTATRTGTIRSLDAAPTVSVSDASVAEGNAGSTNLPFVLTLSAPSERDLRLVIDTTSGTATATTDYTSLVGKAVAFPAGTTSVTVNVKIKADTVAEPNESLTVDLSAPNNVTIADGHGVGTIVNDD